MLDTIWISFGLITQPRETIVFLREKTPKEILMSGLLISILAISSSFLGQFFESMTKPTLIIFEILIYYIGTFFFLSIVMALLIVFYRKSNFVQYIGLYFITDFPLFLVLPLVLLATLFPILDPFISFLMITLFIITLVYKFIITVEFFELKIQQVAVIFSLPTLLLFIWIVSGLVVGINQIAQLL